MYIACSVSPILMLNIICNYLFDLKDVSVNLPFSMVVQKLYSTTFSTDYSTPKNNIKHCVEVNEIYSAAIPCKGKIHGQFLAP